MARFRIAIASLLALSSLVGCASSSGSAEADCSYYQDSANVLLGAIFEAENTPLATATGMFGVSQVGAEEKARNIIKNKLLWADRVLEAPEGCFPKSDIYKAREYKAKWQ